MNTLTITHPNEDTIWGFCIVVKYLINRGPRKI